jgi:hypothetical protein
MSNLPISIIEFDPFFKNIVKEHNWQDRNIENATFKQCSNCGLYASRLTHKSGYYPYTSILHIADDGYIYFSRDDKLVRLTCNEIILRKVL